MMEASGRTNLIANDAPGEVLTFVIADIRGYTQFTQEHGDEAAAELAARFAAAVKSSVERCGGTLLELRGDEALCVFSSARRALRAAIDLQSESGRSLTVGPSPVGVGVGIDAGEAVPVEGGYRGGALNLAARLCSVAGPGEVLASATVKALAGRVEGIDYEDAGVKQLKGLDSPVALFRVASAGQGHPIAAPEAMAVQMLPVGGFLGSLASGRLVGRSREMARVGEIIETVAAGVGRVVALAGEPGAGKTRLAQELTSELLDRDFRIAAGTCYDNRRSTAFYPFLDLLASLYALATPSLRQEIHRRWPVLARLIPPMPSLQARASESEDDQERLFWSVSAMVESLTAARPLAVMIDDLHWADGSSLELLLYLARATRPQPVLLLVTYRDTEISGGHPLEGALRELNRQGLVTRVPVRRLEAAGTRELVSSLLATKDVAPELAATIHERTEGNPFFIHQVVRVLQEHNGSGPDGRIMTKAQRADLEVPESIKSVTAQRFTGLEQSTQEILTKASILGQSFLFEDLLTLVREGAGEQPALGGEEQLEAALEQASRVGLVLSSDGETWRFDHSLTREVLYREISSRRRRRLHQAAARALVASETVSTSSRPDDVAHHFLEADDSAGALPYLVEAGQRAASVAAHAEAEIAFSAARELALEVGDQPTRAIAEERLGETLLITGRYDQAVIHFDAAAALAGECDDHTGQSRLLVRAALAMGRAQKADDALARLGAVIPSLLNGTEFALAARAYAVQARTFMMLGAHEDQLAAAVESERLARLADDGPTLASALIDQATALSDIGLDEDLTKMMEEAIALAEASGDDLLVFRAVNNAAVCCAWCLSPEQVEVYTRRGLEAAERAGSPCEIAFARAVVGLFCWVNGEWTEAGHCFESAAGVAARLGVSTASWTMALPGWLLALKGRVEEASQSLEACLLRAREQSDDSLFVHATLRTAKHDLLLSRPDRALPLVNLILSEHEVQGQWRDDLLLTGFEAALDARDAESINTYVERLESGRLSVPWFEADRRRLMALYLAREGRTGESEAMFQSALDLARGFRYKPTEADVLRSWGEACLATQRAAQARERLTGAALIYRELHARPLAEAVERELLTLGVGGRA